VLILAATPIGNINDASPRLLSSLQESKFIAAEDTRSLLKLANHLKIKLSAELISLHEHNESQKLERLVEIAKTQDLLLVSDAGMPTISDPGFLLVRAAAEAGVEIIIVPGPSAVVSALAVSGLATDRFCFEGFLPRKPGDRRKAMQALTQEPRTMVFFESPHRIADSLKTASEVFGSDRRASVSRELTKKFEETKRGSLEELSEWAKSDPKGEMVLVIEGNEIKPKSPEEVVAEVLELSEEGLGLKLAVAEVAQRHNVSKSELYRLSLLKRQSPTLN
jgi:16S rRNA (cytidine1402-2'-O)-methyltransferase